MAKNLCNAAGFSTLKNQTYDLIEHSEAGEAGFNTEIDWSKFSSVTSMTEVYDDETNIIAVINVGTMEPGLTGYMIQVDEDTSMYMYVSQDMELEGISLTGNTWLSIDMTSGTPTIVPQIPAVFEADPEGIIIPELFEEIVIMGESITTYTPITLEDKVGGVLKDKVYKEVPDKANFLDTINWDNINEETEVYNDEDRDIILDIDLNEGFKQIPTWSAFSDIAEGSLTIYAPMYFNTNIVWSDVSDTLGENDSAIAYIKSGNMIVAYKASYLQTGLTGYIVSAAVDSKTYLITSEDQDIPSISTHITRDTWYKEVIVGSTITFTPEIPTMFEVDSTGINNQDLFDELVMSEDYPSITIGVADPVNEGDPRQYVVQYDKTEQEIYTISNVANSTGNNEQANVWYYDNDGTITENVIPLDTLDPDYVQQRYLTYLAGVYSDDAKKLISYSDESSYPYKNYVISNIPMTEEGVSIDANKWYRLVTGSEPEAIEEKPDTLTIEDFHDIIDFNLLTQICSIEYKGYALENELEDRDTEINDNIDNKYTSIQNSISDLYNLTYARAEKSTKIGGKTLYDSTNSLKEYIADDENTTFNIENGTSYKFNFNVANWLSFVDNPKLNKLGYEIYSNYTSSNYVEGHDNYYPSLYIATDLDQSSYNTYSFHIYPKKDEYPGKWLKNTYNGDNVEEWSNPSVSFTYHESGLVDQSEKGVNSEYILKQILTYDDDSQTKRASEDAHLIDGQVYNIDFDVLNYISIFGIFVTKLLNYDDFYRDSYINIRCAGTTDKNGITIRLNGFYHCLSSALITSATDVFNEGAYPFIWRKQINANSEPYTKYDLAEEHYNTLYYLDTTQIKSGKKDIFKKLLYSQATNLKDTFDNFRNWKFDDTYDKQAGGSLVEGKYYLLKHKTDFNDISTDFDGYPISTKVVIYNDNKGNRIEYAPDYKPNAGGAHIYFDVYENGSLVSNGTTWYDVTLRRDVTHSYAIYVPSSTMPYVNLSYMPKAVYIQYKSAYVLKPDMFARLVDTTYAFEKISNTVQEKIELDLLNTKPYNYIPTISLKAIPDWSKISDLYLEKGFDYYGEVIYNSFNDVYTTGAAGKIIIGYDKSPEAWYVKISINSDKEDECYVIASNDITRSSAVMPKDTWYYQENNNSAWTQISTPTLVINKTLIENKYLFGTVFNYVNTLEEAINSISQFPACPTDTDGTYVLEATVSSGEVTYAWVLKSS